jgi:hypothetical protein
MSIKEIQDTLQELNARLVDQVKELVGNSGTSFTDARAVKAVKDAL